MEKAIIISAEEYQDYYEYKAAEICKGIIDKLNMCNTSENPSVSYPFADVYLKRIVARTLNENHGIMVSNIVVNGEETILFFTKVDKINTVDDDESSIDFGMAFRSYNLAVAKSPKKSIVPERQLYDRRQSAYEKLDSYSIETGFVKYMA